jgi:hypothetical protein
MIGSALPYGADLNPALKRHAADAIPRFYHGPGGAALSDDQSAAKLADAAQIFAAAAAAGRDEGTAVSLVQCQSGHVNQGVSIRACQYGRVNRGASNRGPCHPIQHVIMFRPSLLDFG